MNQVARVQELEDENAFLRRQLGIEADRDTVRKLAAALNITHHEAHLLSLLYAKRGGTVSRNGLMDAMYAGPDDEPNIKIIDVWVCKLRRKIGAQTILTLYCMGYGLSPEGQELCRRAIAGEYRR